MKRLVLRSFQSPGDALMLTAAVRDLHKAHPGQFQTDVRTSADALWLNNPYRTVLREGEPGVETLDMHYPLIHQSNERPYHFIHGYVQYLEERLHVRIPVTRFCGDIHLSSEEQEQRPSKVSAELPARYWIIVAGGKYDFTAKWWNPAGFQKVVDHFQGRIQFVQCGEAGHWHPALSGVVNLVGKTSLRDFVQLMHHADGVVCPVTFAMHLAAAVETKRGGPRPRPCVVVAGGREPPHWEAYPTHQFISTVGTLNCCAEGGCWRSRCQLVGDGDEKDRRNLCEHPVQLTPELRIPRCMDMITPDDVIRRIDLYLDGRATMNGADTRKQTQSGQVAVAPAKPRISASFYHGLGDCAHFAHLIPLYIKRGYEVEIECTPDKRILFEATGARTISQGAKQAHPWGYPAGGSFVGHGKFWQGSKIGHNISEPPLPSIGSKGELWDEYCATKIDIRPHLPADALATAERWLEELPRPVILLHTKGNTGQQQKSLPDGIAAEFYKGLIDRTDGTLILLDWDNRVPRLPSYRVRHLDNLGPCPTEVLLALMHHADLMIGVDSGPLHAARFTNIPTVGIWMPGHYPSTYTVPRRQQLNVVLADHTRQWNRYKRIPWQLVEHSGSSFDARTLADWCARMLQPPRYLQPGDIAADLQLQQFIWEWCRAERGVTLSSYADRNRSFDVLFREIGKRFEKPLVIETGTVRAEEDWGGTGFFTYLAGAYLSKRGGTLHSVDLSPASCDFARTWTAVFGPAVQIHREDSVSFLANFPGRIDVLYLDSLDTTDPGHAAHAVREFEAAAAKLHQDSLLLIDDTPWQNGAFVGKGARLVPVLLERGWKILYAGYQVLLGRAGESPVEVNAHG
jgi:ADP-heptose:LPS heptosyltransferase